MDFIGIDYGSKMAGTTVIAFLTGQQLHFNQSGKKKDADAFLADWVDQHHPKRVFLDAPLSLPGVYTQPGDYEDYFYRTGDRELRAMSPMFLGGLTARAMQLRRRFDSLGIEVLETYPSQMTRVLGLDRKRYKKDKSYLSTAASDIASYLPGLTLAEPPANWHQVDALLAFCSGWRYQRDVHDTFGDPDEGHIVV